MAQLNGKKPFVGVSYISKNTGRTVVVEVSNNSKVLVRDKGRVVELNTSTFYDHYRRAPNQPAAMVRDAQEKAVAKPRVKQSEFEND